MDTKEDKARVEEEITQRITVCTSDEVGKLVKGVNLFIITLQKIMQEIVSSSADLSDTFYKVNDSISEVNKNTGDISVAMEEVAATMDTVATTIHDINDHRVTWWKCRCRSRRDEYRNQACQC